MAFSEMHASAAGENFESGYVVTLPGDTLKGLVLMGDHATNVKRCVFKPNATGSETNYAPGEILAYGNLTSRHFKSFSKSSPEGEVKIFIERIVPGKISLYYNDEDFFIDHDGRVEQLVEIQKEITKDGRTYLVKQPLYRATLQNAMSDCPKIFPTVTAMKLSEKSILDLLKQYNECIGIAPPVNSSPRNKLAVRFGLGAGVMLSSMTSSSNNSPNYLFMNTTSEPASTLFTPSLWLEIWRPGVNNRVRYRTGLIYYSTTYHQYHESTLAGLSYDFNLVFSSIELPLNIKYSFTGKGLYVFGGVAVGKILTFDDKTTIKTYPGNSFVMENSSLEMTNVLLRFNGGVGYEIPLGQRSILFEADYRFTSNITKTSTGTPSAHLGSFAFTLGVPLTKNRK